VVVDVAEVEALAHKSIDLAAQLAASKIQGIKGGGWFGDVLRNVASNVVSEASAGARKKFSEELHGSAGKKG
jgi:hypothetical protein